MTQLQINLPGNQQKQTPKKALLVNTYQNHKDKQESQDFLDELERLVETYGLQIVGKVACHIREYSSSTLLSKGKLEETISLAKELQADVVIFDDEVIPSQQRNLEKAFGIPVIDRTEVILAVFAQRAQTKEARLQIELAQVQYQFPRLKRLWTHLSRQSSGGSGGGFVKGEGEKQMEIDRRLLKKQVDSLRQELAIVRKNRSIQRSARNKTGIPIFAIVGYTNAGKSTLMQALTKADVLVEDKLFATLDTTTRKFSLPNNQDILLIDTVGFIRKLPHTLVEAFKSTLEESAYADILLHLIDASHPHAEKQAEATFEVLKQLKADKKPIITVLNKVDKVLDRGIIDRLRFRYPHTVQISATTEQGFEELMNLMIEMIKARRIDMRLCIPQKDYNKVSDILHQGQILQTEYEDNNIFLHVDIPIALANQLAHYQQKPVA
ncbi:MAG: hflX [Chlamydiales bacterium]|jgi:GTP-binding protein HflX|nr:hflX [Chlamydiales bacterium]